MKADRAYSQHPSNIPPTSLQTAKKACFSAFPTTSGIRALLRAKNAREPSKIGRSGCIEGVSSLHSLTLPYNPPEQLKIPRWQHRTGSSPVTGTKIRYHFDTMVSDFFALNLSRSVQFLLLSTDMCTLICFDFLTIEIVLLRMYN